MSRMTENTPKTTDIALAGYLRAKGFGLLGTEEEGRMITFIFGQEAGEVFETWHLRPNDEMRLIKNFVIEREQLFRLLKESRNSHETYR